MDKALEQYNIAHHLFNVTYPLIKDPKLLIGINHNIFLAMDKTIDSILLSEKQLDIIPPYSKTFYGKLNLFQLKSVKKNKIPQKMIQLIMDLHKLLEEHKKSPIEFQRGKQFVICNNNYQLNVLSPKMIQKNLETAKDFIKLSEKIINENNEILRKQ